MALKRAGAGCRGKGSNLAENQAGVVPAEARIVAHREVDGERPGLVWNVVQVAIGIGFLVIDGGRDQTGLDGLAAGGRLDGPGGTQKMACHRLGGAHQEGIPGMVAEVDILTGKKTVLDYLLKPVLQARERAMRER